MVITEMARSLKKNVLLPLVALSMVGVFSFVSFADEATVDKPTTENPAVRTDDSAPAGKIERAGQATGRGVKRASNATGKGVKHAGKATGSGVTRAANATGRGIERAGKATGR